MYTIAVVNQKGGVGKTSTVLSLGAGLTLKGYKVLYIDLDPQGNLSYSLQGDTSQYSALTVLQRPNTAPDEIQHTDKGDIIASTPGLTGADATINEVGKEYRLSEALETVSDIYDFCLIDTPPALGILTVNALTASDGVIIPAQADIYSLQGTGQLALSIRTIRKYTNPSLEILGILITRFNARTNLSQQLADALERAANELDTKVYDTRIREAVAVKESQAVQENIFSYDKRANVTNDYKEFVDEVLNDIKEGQDD